MSERDKQRHRWRYYVSNFLLYLFLILGFAVPSLVLYRLIDLRTAKISYSAAEYQPQQDTICPERGDRLVFTSTVIFDDSLSLDRPALAEAFAVIQQRPGRTVAEMARVPRRIIRTQPGRIMVPAAYDLAAELHYYAGFERLADGDYEYQHAMRDLAGFAPAVFRVPFTVDCSGPE